MRGPVVQDFAGGLAYFSGDLAVWHKPLPFGELVQAEIGPDYIKLTYTSGYTEAVTLEAGLTYLKEVGLDYLKRHGLIGTKHVAKTKG
jgi:hypothetical protein